MRKLVAALACRNEGTRLYGKPMQNLDIDSKTTILDNLIDCLRNIECIDDTVLGIAEGPHNAAYVDYSRSKRTEFIIGDEIDVLQRLIQCGNRVGATDIFRTSSESPFVYYEAIEDSWKSHVDKNADATFLENVPDGTGLQFVKLDALKQQHDLGEDRHRSELCTLYIRENKDKFVLNYIQAPQEVLRMDIRLTVDYPEDLIVCRAVYQYFKEIAPMIPLTKIIEYLDQNPKLVELITPFCEEGYKTMYK